MRLTDQKISTISIFILWLFYGSAIIGIVLGYLSWFLPYTPFTLLLCFLLIVWNTKTITHRDAVFLFIPICIGTLAEIIGVRYTFLFGSYQYGANLGWKFLDIPWVIGVNWLLLVYASSGIGKFLFSNRIVSIVFSSFLMVGLDYWMEKAAPLLDYWSFHSETVPLQNYIGWFLVSLLAHSCFQPFFNKENVTLSTHLLIAIFAFFLTSIYLLLPS